MTTKSRATWICKQFNSAINKADCVTINDGPILRYGTNEENTKMFFSGTGDEFSLHIPKTSFLPKNNPFFNDNQFELKDSAGDITIIKFFKLAPIKS